MFVAAAILSGWAGGGEAAESYPVAGLIRTAQAAQAARTGQAGPDAAPPSAARPRSPEAGIDPALAAPKVSETASGVNILHNRLAVADALATALFRVQNNLAILRSRSTQVPGCDHAEAIDLALRAESLGPALRDATQAARAQADRVGLLLAAPTVQPLLDAALHYRATTLLDHSDELQLSYLEAAAWQARYAKSLTRRCDAELKPADGLRAEPTWTVSTGDSSTGLVAVIALAGGWVCPGGFPGVGRPVIVRSTACYGDVDCDCTPVPVLPAAVLGPRR